MSNSSRGTRTFRPRKSVKLVAGILWVLRTPYREDQLRDIVHGYRRKLAVGRGKLPFWERAIKADQWIYRELTACVISAFGMGLGKLITLIFRIGS